MPIGGLIMALPYSEATSGKNAINEIQKILRGFNCTKFATGEDFDTGEVFVQFEHQGKMVIMKVSAQQYAAAWLKENPYNSRRKGSEADHKQRALNIGSVAIYSILRDWIKGQITAIEIGLLTFDSAFLSHIMLPDGKRIIDKVTELKMLPEE
jgi:hypothetical protein